MKFAQNPNKVNNKANKPEFTLENIAITFKKVRPFFYRKNKLNRKLVIQILGEVNKQLLNYMLTESGVIEMGYGMGKLFIGSRKIFNPLNMPSENRNFHKRLVHKGDKTYYFYTSENFCVYFIKWKKYKLKNRSYYTFKTARTVSTKISRLVKEGKLTHF